MACGDKKAACRIAILDPKLTVTQPERVTALTGIDAVTHALETYVTTRRNPMSLMFSREAWRLLNGNFLTVLEQPENLAARGAMLWGASLAGLAIENSMLGAAHALANPLTQHYGVVHGQAVAAMLPHVIRFNAAEVGGMYAELLGDATTDTAAENSAATNGAGEQLAERVTLLVTAAGLKTQLRDLKVESSRLIEMSQGAAQQWTGKFNPRPVGEAELLELYQAAL